MAPYRTAAMIFTAVLDLEARRKAKETSKARRRKIRRLKQHYGSVHICENSNKLGRVTSQSKVENRMAPYRTAAMIFTAAILDLEARRKAKETWKARRRKIRCLKQQQPMRQTTTCPAFCSITHCNYFKQPPLGCLK